MEEEGESQKSMTDKEARLMKNNGKFSVCYNNQVLVDEGSHLVLNYNVDNNPSDTGTMEKIVKEAKEITKKEDEVVINITDKGYNERKDMGKCLEEGIIPEVTLPEGKKYYEIEIEYEEGEVREEERESSKKEDIKKRMGISEHAHGSMKRSDHASYFLMKGKEKVNGEMALYYLGYNLRRLINIKGVKELKKYLEKRIEKRVMA